jgi:tetratricopeptide (TPR) repeat protein
MVNSSQIPRALHIFCSYAYKDKRHFETLVKHMASLLREGKIKSLHDGGIEAGKEWREDIDMYTKAADIIILLISSDFIASDHCREVQMKQAIELSTTGVAKLFSIILRPSDLQGLPLDQSILLPPPDGKPISTWNNKEAAFLAVVTAIRKVVDEIMSTLPYPKKSRMPLWMVPQARNRFFTGRDNVLDALYEYFTSKQSARPIQALSGTGGIGKTQIAVEYAYRYRNRYGAIFWVRADAHDLFSADITAIAEGLGIPQAERNNEQRLFRAVRQWLQQNRRWLLLLDNLEDLHWIDQIIPPQCNGHVLFTTHIQAVGNIARPLIIEKMTPDDSVLFLLRRVRIIPERGTTDQAPPTDHAQALRIAQEVDGFPLALDQAGAYIEDIQQSLAHYLTLYCQRRSALLKQRGTFESGHKASVTTTLQLAFHEVRQTQPDAIELLHLFAFMHPDTIPDEMIVNGARELNEPLRTLAADEFSLDTAISVLFRFSLISRNEDRTMLNIHRVVQDVIKGEIALEQQFEWASCVVRMVSKVFPDADFDTWHLCERYFPQAQISAKHITDFHIMGPEAAQLLYRLGNYCYDSALYNEGGKYLRAALHLYKHASGPESIETVRNLNALALLYNRQAKYELAESLQQQSLNIHERIVGPNHIETTSLLNNLAFIYQTQDKYASAEAIYRQTLQIKEQARGVDHSENATTLNNLAQVLADQGNYTEAEPLHQRALAIRQKNLPAGHPDIAQSMTNMAILYQNQAKYELAETFFKNAFAICQQAFGPDHPDTAMSLGNLAQFYETQQAHYQQAESYYERAIAIMEKVSGPNHPDTATFLCNQAVLYRKQKKYQQAEMNLKRSLAIYEQIFGKNHENTAFVFNNLGMLYLAQGYYNQAEVNLKRAVEIYEHELGPNHPDTAKSLSNLAELYASQQHTSQQAEPFYQRVLAIYEQIFGPEHLSSMPFMEQYAHLLEIRQETGKAQILQQAILRIKEKHAYKTPKPST